MPCTLITEINRGKLSGLCADAITELQRACAKPPFFPDALLSSLRPGHLIGEQLDLARACNDRAGGSEASAYSVVVEELLEFFDAAGRGDRAAAEAELVQTMAMLLRIHAHPSDYVK